MIEIRFHGRGGQGAVIASWILSYGFFLEGKHAQAFPTFGADHRIVDSVVAAVGQMAEMNVEEGKRRNRVGDEQAFN